MNMQDKYMTVTEKTTGKVADCIKPIGKRMVKAVNYKRVIRSARLTILCGHHYNLRDLTQEGILADEASELYFVSCRFSPPTSTQSRAHRGVACLNAKSRHCRSRYLYEHALVKHSSIWPVSRPISSTRSPCRVSPHATRGKSLGAGRKTRAATRKEGRTEGRIKRCTDNRRNRGNVCIDILDEERVYWRNIKVRPEIQIWK